ncbi:MAG TPA: protein kinase [Labilithrix sp.]|nr:protein kinase [Labilithrix sp.]
MTTQPVPSLQLGKYRLIIELAQGGMGNVYLAVAQGPAGFSKLSVIKELKPSLLEEQGFLEMFLDEARLSARLSHPNVVQTNEVSVEGGRAFIAMEYLEGQSLVRVRSRLGKRQKLPLGVHLRVIAEACRGLEYAHQLCDFDGTPLHVVHRDVSPHNIFVTYDGQVKIVDFGVAKALSSNHETTVGVMKGKVPYMAPEQVMGAEMDRRVDVFALGVILWEAIANRRMWDQMRTETILAKLMSNDIPRLATVAPDAPPRLIALVDRATAASPDARFPSAEALRLAIEEYLQESGEGAHHTLRELGGAMMEGFAYERAQVSAAVTEQLRLLRQSPDALSGVAIVRLPAVPATASQPSGMNSGNTVGLQISGGYPQVWHPGMSEPPPGGDQSGSGSGSVSHRFGRPPEASTSMALASPPRFSAAPATSSGRPLAIVAGVLLVAVAALAAVVVVGTRGKGGTHASTIDASGAGDPIAAGNAPSAPDTALPSTPTAVLTSTLAGQPPAGDSDAASATAGSVPSTGRARPPIAPPVRPGQVRPPVVTTAVADPPPPPPPKTTKPDLGY